MRFLRDVWEVAVGIASVLPLLGPPILISLVIYAILS